jgi:hypothetical protein
MFHWFLRSHVLSVLICWAHLSQVSFRLVRADGSVVECKPDSADPVRIVFISFSDFQEIQDLKELFGLCLGGYGLFGIIYEVTLKVRLLSFRDFPIFVSV